MRLWPFGRAETRASASNAAIDALLAGASVAAPQASATAAATAAIGAVGSVLATSRPSALQDILSPAFLRDYAQRMLLHGNAIYLVDIEDGLTLIPAASFEVGGGYRSSSWMYSLELNRPSGSPITRRLPGAGVVHVSRGAAAATPWLGRSPLQGCLAADALAQIERSLGFDSSLPTGGLMPQPDGASPKAINQAQTALTTGKGGIALIETTTAGYGQGKEAAPKGDWDQKRYGPMVPESSISFRDSASMAVLSAIGVSNRLFDGDGAAQRESHRLLVAGVCQELCALLENEVAVKLGTPVTIDLSPSTSVDARGLGRAVGSLVQAGIELEEAKTIAGLNGRLA